MNSATAHGRERGHPSLDRARRAESAPSDWRLAPGGGSRERLDTAMARVGPVLGALPARAQPLLLDAAILRVQARYGDALDACRRLAEIHPGRVADVCIADLRSLEGDDAAYAHLRRRLLCGDGATPLDTACAAWIHVATAEIADRVGEPRAAEMHFRHALAHDGGTHALGAFARWLLDERRADEAIALLHRVESRPADATDALLLAWVIARRRVDLAGVPGSGPASADAPQAVSDAVRRLRVRLAAAAPLGDSSLARERVRLALEVDLDPTGALRQARSNWTVRREPVDARLLARAASAAADADALRTLAAEIGHIGMHDLRLDALLRAATPAPP
ncbi:MAG: tetratricopeptide repeat protein [Lautropia sp.]